MRIPIKPNSIMQCDLCDAGFFVGDSHDFVGDSHDFVGDSHDFVVDPWVTSSLR